MKCFVASAFGRDDVDAIYDKAIRKVLRSFDITPVRVDRVEHNDEIDNKIFELLDAADMCIADLTYARPSVYYEAGYAFAKGKPVIYVARRDHFRARDNDPLGNERVHFDLQMKNIIDWTKPDDTFRKRLARRIKLAIAPLVKKQKTSEAERELEREFGSKSVHWRITALENETEAILRSRGFSEETTDNLHPTGRFRRIKKGVLQQVHVAIATDYLKREVLNLMRPMTMSAVGQEKGKITREFHSALILAPLRALRISTVATWLPRYHQTYEGVFQADLGDLKWHRAIAKPVKLSIIPLSTPKTANGFRVQLEQALDKIGFTPSKSRRTRGERYFTE